MPELVLGRRGHPVRFDRRGAVIDDDLRWTVVWWFANGSHQQREGTIADAQRLPVPHRAVIDCVVDAINAS